MRLPIEEHRPRDVRVEAVGDSAAEAPRPGSRVDAIGNVGHDAVSPLEIAELVTESDCLLAPQKMVALLSRPAD